MTNFEKGIAELQTMQQASPKLRKSNKRSAAATREHESGAAPASRETSTPDDIAKVVTGAAAEAEDIIEGLTEQLHDVVQDLEQAAIERPVLALLAAFGIGVIVGQLLARK